MTIFTEIEAFLAQPPELKTSLLALAIQHCRQRLALAKEQKQWLSFDDLLTHLSAALDSESGDSLAEKIRTQFPVAMIDEFQDTDPLQYQIFSHVYLSHADCGWFMIGDPKQAIYGFRGADIFTYIQARNQVQDHYTLGTNWRSSESMVNGVNALFKQADSAFLYDDDIPFHAVNASPKASKMQWQFNGEHQAAMQFWLQDAESPVAKSEYVPTMAAATAQHIKQVLTQSQTGKAALINGDKNEAIEAGNIAVLVRTGSEGQLIKQALAERGIASVYLSNRDSVFTSEIADDLLRLMLAVWHQDDERMLKSALAPSYLLCLPFNWTASIMMKISGNKWLLNFVTIANSGYRAVFYQCCVQYCLSEKSPTDCCLLMVVSDYLPTISTWANCCKQQDKIWRATVHYYVGWGKR